MAQGSDRDIALQIDNVTKTFPRTRRRESVQALRGVSISLLKGQVVSIVGESGSGKSTLARVALMLEAPDSGELRVGTELIELRDRKMGKSARRFIRSVIQPVFQDSGSAFNPRRNIFQTLTEGRFRRDRDLHSECAKILEDVGLRPGESFLRRYPHQLSGGQRQRLGIARALIRAPKIALLDEPLSGADVSIRGQILNLLGLLQRQKDLSIIMITHDLSVACAISDRIYVMSAGRVVDEGSPEYIANKSTAPVTRGLIEAVPGSSRLTPRLRDGIDSRGNSN